MGRSTFYTCPSYLRDACLPKHYAFPVISVTSCAVLCGRGGVDLAKRFGCQWVLEKLKNRRVSGRATDFFGFPCSIDRGWVALQCDWRRCSCAPPPSKWMWGKGEVTHAMHRRGRLDCTHALQLSMCAALEHCRTCLVGASPCALSALVGAHRASYVLRGKAGK